MSLCMKTFLHLFVAFVVGIKSAASQTIVETLPGYDGSLPFKLETGYIGVGEDDEVQLFYYFIESQNDPNRDPLLLWLPGGPGCAGLDAFFYEIGPLAFDFESFDGSLPSLLLNPYSWTKWLLAHPEFIKNRLYVSGDSYGGKIVPMVALEIAKGNEAGLEPIMSLKGYTVGNPTTNAHADKNERIPYAHRMALISDKQFKRARISCNGQYVNPDPNNIKCSSAIYSINQCTKLIYTSHILEPICKPFSAKPSGNSRRFLPSIVDDAVDLLSLSGRNELTCRDDSYVTSYVWANDKTVRDALHIIEGTVPDWTRCNLSLSYEKDIEIIVEYHQKLSDRGFQALVYSGDHDMIIPYISTLKWIHKLNVSVYDEWRAWTVDGQVAG